MAHRITTAPLDADSNRDSSPAGGNDWHYGVADLHLGTGHPAPTQDAGYTTASESLSPKKPISLYLRGESIYDLLGSTELEALHFAQIDAALGLPQVVAMLHRQPTFGRTSESLGETQGHLRAYPTLPSEDTI
jgi:hypothetical protein